MNTCRVCEIEAVEEDESKQHFLQYSVRVFVEGRRTAPTAVGEPIEKEGYCNHYYNDSQHYIAVSKEIRLITNGFNTIRCVAVL